MQKETEEPKAKRTEYDGYTFRSRNEAKWAVFFNYMRIEYVYEERDIQDRYSRVLPDFYLPKLNVYVEVKRDDFSKEVRDSHIRKYGVIPRTTGKPCMIAYGNPYKCISSREWNESVLLFNAVRAAPTGEVYPSDEIMLCCSRCWFTNPKDSNGGIIPLTELATDIDCNKFHTVLKFNDEWCKHPSFMVSNPRVRIAERVALYARQSQFEYAPPLPEPDSDEADEAINAIWRSKYPPKATYAGTGYGPAPAWAN